MSNDYLKFAEIIASIGGSLLFLSALMFSNSNGLNDQINVILIQTNITNLKNIVNITALNETVNSYTAKSLFYENAGWYFLIVGTFLIAYSIYLMRDKRKALVIIMIFILFFILIVINYYFKILDYLIKFFLN